MHAPCERVAIETIVHFAHLFQAPLELQPSYSTVFINGHHVILHKGTVNVVDCSWIGRVPVNGLQYDGYRRLTGPKAQIKARESPENCPMAENPLAIRSDWADAGDSDFKRWINSFPPQQRPGSYNLSYINIIHAPGNGSL